MPRATLKDVASKANVSRTTASLILNCKYIRVSEETRQKVLSAAQELQYTPNALIRSLQTQLTHTIGVYIGAGEDLLNTYIGTLFKAIRGEAERQGYDVLIYRIGEAKKAIEVNKFLDGRVDGLIYWGGMRLVSYSNLARSNLPIITLLDQPDLPGLSSLTFDDASGMRQVFRHLTDLGHRHISYIPGNQRMPHLRRRMDIFSEILRSFKSMGVYGEILDSSESGLSLAESLSALNKRPTAIICAFDTLSLKCLAAAEELNISVPQDLSIVNWEELIYPASQRFTGVAHDVHLLGIQTVKSLVNIIQGESPQALQEKLPVEFHIRDTTTHV